MPGTAQHDSSIAGAPAWGYVAGDAQNHRALTDANGGVTRRVEYDAFGQQLAASGTATSEFGYGGEQQDSETGLINLRARYYDPALGRFISRDSHPGESSSPHSLYETRGGSQETMVPVGGLVRGVGTRRSRRTLSGGAFPIWRAWWARPGSNRRP